MYARTQEIVRDEPQPLTPSAFQRLLAWLDDGVDSDGEQYRQMRRRLVFYFDRRNRPNAEDLADETLTRIGRTLQDDGVIATTPPARYCYGVAKFVLFSDVRRERKHVPLGDPLSRGDFATRPDARAALDDEPRHIRERRLECLDRGLNELRPDQRALVIEYYRDGGREKIERRRELAKRLGITMNALSMRMSRIRAALETSVENCMKQRRPRPTPRWDDRSRRVDPASYDRRAIGGASAVGGRAGRLAELVARAVHQSSPWHDSNEPPPHALE
jgi:DNA-directed RNA polymerase specialized sigma24 family protein